MKAGIVIEAASLYLPIVLFILLVVLIEKVSNLWVGVLVACTWLFASLPWINYAALKLGWWKFESETVSLLGTPLALYIGWVILWGGVAVLLQEWLILKVKLLNTRSAIAIVLGVFLILDLLLMPLMQPTLSLSAHWYWGELCLIFFILTPALLIARAFVAGKWLFYRATHIAVSFSILLLTVLPLVTSDTSLELALEAVQKRPLFFNIMILMGVVTFATIGMSAVQEFAKIGKGTPIPYDPPKKLVISGVYSYCSNPMQLSMCGVLFCWGALFENIICILLAIVCIIYSVGIATWSERIDLKKRHGSRWQRYVKSVKNWKLRILPYDEKAQSLAQLFIAKDCDICQQVEEWFRTQDMKGIEIVDAERYPQGSLSRITYLYPDGVEVEHGTNAIGTAFQHIHLGYAFLGWVMKLPILSNMIQLSVDVSGGGEREK